jgi:hypothetical protein
MRLILYQIITNCVANDDMDAAMTMFGWSQSDVIVSLLVDLNRYTR